MRKRIMYLGVLVMAVVMLLLSISTTLAAWAASASTLNKISIDEISARVENYFYESYDYPEDVLVMPGDKVDNIVKVRNTCNIDIAVRLSYEIAWISYEDEFGNIVIDTDLSADNILVTCNTVDWEYEPNDGYHYYKGILAPNELSPAVVTTIKLDESIGNEFKNRRAHIDIYMEAIQAVGEAITVWGKTYEELEIEYENPANPIDVSKVSFVNPAIGFRFENNNGDLFSGFKNLLPSEGRTQQVEISNLYDYDVRIHLFATLTEQSHINAEDFLLIEKILREYATIVVTNDQGDEIYNGPIWADSLATNNFMGEINKVDLGVFAPKNMKTLTVNLWLDKEVDNEYMGLFGDVIWHFEAQNADSNDPWGEKPTPTPKPTSGPDTKPPVTGDKSLLYAGIAGIILSLGLIAAVLYRMKRDEEASV